MRAEELKGHLDAMLLAALEPGSRHGYAVIEALRQDTGGRLDLPTGTIYPALRRLEQSGLVSGSWSVVAGRRRRLYGVVPGLALAAVIVLLAIAARSTRYRSVGRAGAAGCIGIALLDAAMITGVLAADPAIRQAAVVAVAASAARIGYSARLLRPVLTRQ